MTKFGSVLKVQKLTQTCQLVVHVHVVYALTCPTMTVDGFYSDAHY